MCTIRIIFLLLLALETTLVAMQPVLPYANISRFNLANKRILFRATRIPEGTSIEVEYDPVSKSYWGCESMPTGNNLLDEKRAEQIFKELAKIKPQ